MDNIFTKVLISAPTANVKDYCFDAWIENIMQFKYPNFEVKVFDNSLDEGKASLARNVRFLNAYGKQNTKFQSIYSNITSEQSLIERMCISHNDCRDEFLNGDYTHMLHLETDVVPPHDIIERLMEHNKSVIGAVYYRNEGQWRQPMIQQRIYRAPKNVIAINVNANEEPFFLDGTVKGVASAGLGCVLIKREVLEKIKFRFVAGENLHPDCFFNEDCFRNKINTFVDTSIICRHDNKAWGYYGVDYK